MPEAGRLLGMSERGARDWVRRRAIPTHGACPVRVSEQAVLAAMAAEGRAPRKSPGTASEASPEVSPEAPGSGPELIEATYRTGAVVASPAASALIAAIRDEWLQPLVDRIAELERERGRLEAEWDAAERAAAELRQRAEQAEVRLLRSQRRTELAEGEANATRMELALLKASHAAPAATSVSLRMTRPPQRAGRWGVYGARGGRSGRGRWRICTGIAVEGRRSR